ncbi:hypothetical protein HO133_010293 [Letharia lupina]|uniref:Major facilitator superfamily (MFS) profile domain-containing protein n=1 Tax=Letharia lupina TaxID=560253 RepID=A0A8H6FE33_9LECA|nr:uncharacterized protein HO133_010293 [Letharia lupina]KAF6225097.1 hypothetical protein HO133_010293 [Letharia lupina]
MSLSKPSERSPLLRQVNDAQNVPAEGKPHDDGEWGVSNSLPSRHEQLSNARLALIMGSIWVGVVLIAVDSTIVATLLVPISSSFSSLKTLSWIGSAYLIGQSVTQPLSGRLTDIFGRRQGLLVCNFVFGLGTLLCGVAPSEWVLITGRTIAGLGGGATVTICMFVAGDLVPLRKRGVLQGIGNIIIGAGSGIGGLLGGWINGLAGWRVAFLVQVPFVIVGAVMVFFTVKVPVKISERSALKRVDYLGSFTLTCALVLFLLGLNTGGNVLAWTHPLVLTALPLSIVFLSIFVYVEENRALEPIIPIRILLNRTVASACLSYWFVFMAYFGLTYFMPVYLQLLGKSPTEAGLRFIPFSAGAAVGAFAAGLIMKATGNYYYLDKCSHALLVLSTALTVTMNANTPTVYPFIYLAVFGLGVGGILVTTLIALVSAVEQEHQAVVTSAGFAFRSTGSVIGLTIASAAFQNLLRVKLHRSIGSVADAEGIIDKIREDFDEIGRLPAELRGLVQQDYMEAVQGVFIVVCGFSVLASVSSLFMRQHKLHANLERR